MNTEYKIRISKYENDLLDDGETFDLFEDLVASGDIWSMKRSYWTLAIEYIIEGWIELPESQRKTFAAMKEKLNNENLNSGVDRQPGHNLVPKKLTTLEDFPGLNSDRIDNELHREVP
jgi:hypothetical protein